ncbi:MAG: hypothetical protein LBG21_03580 [Campylobacteraceae bacterium]|nr:hypothetical protein [Campylobacteraceae bacterium]
MDTKNEKHILDVIQEGLEKWDMRDDFFSQGKSLIYNDESISTEYSILETPLGEKFLVDLDENRKLVRIKQIQ